MAYITDYVYTSDDLNVASHTGELPVYDVGDLLIWCVSKDSGTGTSLTVPAGWTSVLVGQYKNEVLVCYKIATASETPPTTSSSDTDAYQSTMFAVKEFDPADPVSTADAAIDNSTVTTVFYNYFTPPSSKNGNIHFCFLTASGVGGASVENYGYRYVNEETTSMGMVIHSKPILDITDVPASLEALQHTGSALIQFEVNDAGNGITEATVDYYIDPIEYLTDGAISTTALGVNNSSLAAPGITFNGKNVLAPASITDVAGDLGFYPFQKAAYIKGVKSPDYAAAELAFSSSFDLSGGVLLALSIYPYKPKYQPAIGYGDEGRFIYLMDSLGNYRAYNVDAANNKMLNYAMQWSYIIDPMKPGFAESSTPVDLTDINRIGFGERSRTIVCYVALNRVYRYWGGVVYGGNSVLKASLDNLIRAQDGAYFRPFLVQGHNYMFQGPITIGKSGVTTVFEEVDKVIEFPAEYNPDKGEFLGHVNSNDITLEPQPNDSIVFTQCTFQATSKWGIYSSTTTGSILFDSCIFKYADYIDLSLNGDITRCTFVNCPYVQPSTGILSNSTFKALDAVGEPAHVLLTNTTPMVDFSNNTFTEYPGGFAIMVDASITELTIDGSTFDHSGIADIYWNGTSGTLTVNCINNANPTSWDSSGGTVNIINNKLFTFTVEPSVTNYEWRIYEVPTKGSLQGSVELAGEELATSSTQTYSYNYSQDKVVAVQIIGHSNDIVESVTYYTLSDQNQAVTINLKTDLNN